MKTEPPKTFFGITVDPIECPFREFKDAELSVDFWGMGPAQMRYATQVPKATKPSTDTVWIDDQIQPLPRSVRRFLNGWERAEDLALSRWDMEVVIFEDADGGKMNVLDYQFAHTQVLLRSSFCRQVLSHCFILEMTEGLTIEHQWDNFTFNFGTEGWRAKFHIYSPGMKAGGGAQHRPTLSRNGCYLVRLFYLGVWRCVWVNDLVPVDATGAPLLPFSPLTTKPSLRISKIPTGTGPLRCVLLWPMLMCKALLKLAAPDMTEDDMDLTEDEDFLHFDMMQALTGCLSLSWTINDNPDDTWDFLTRELPPFTWDDDDYDNITNTSKGKPVKKPNAKDAISLHRSSIVTMFLEDTKSQQPFVLPGITPAYDFPLLITMTRDVPIKKPLPEPDVEPWKYIRWVDWARSHGLYDAYMCPRTKYLMGYGFLKVSYAPHLLDVISNESITYKVQNTDPQPKPKKGGKETPVSPQDAGRAVDESRDWINYESVFQFANHISVGFIPSMYQFASAASAPSVHTNKGSSNKQIDLQMPKTCPLYLQIDSGTVILLVISLNVMNEKILYNAGSLTEEDIGPSYLFLEEFDWFKGSYLMRPKAFLQTYEFDSVEVQFQPGRHYCRLWIHSQLHWQTMLVTQSNLVLGTKDVIQACAIQECLWVHKFLLGIGNSFASWIRSTKSSASLANFDKDFFSSYLPDLPWDDEVIGYSKIWIHVMFRKALQSLLVKRLVPQEYMSACRGLRRLFYDPDFGLPDKPHPPKQTIRETLGTDPCDCDLSKSENTAEEIEAEIEEEKIILTEEQQAMLLTPPKFPNQSQLCELATDDVPCGKLRDEREKLIRRHEAATCIQSYWRRAWVQKCFNSSPNLPADVVKGIMDSAFGSIEALMSLMNEFFTLFPETQSVYSAATGMSGVWGLQQHSGSAPATPKCIWIPFFQANFNCHMPVLVNFDLLSSIDHQIFAVYDNDTGLQVPYAFNSPIIYEFKPNDLGFTIMGHGSMNKTSDTHFEVHWQFTIMTSVEGVFHCCDNSDYNFCKELPLQQASKLHVENVFIPNRRNILGGIHMTVTKQDCVGFRVAASNPSLEMEASLKTTVLGRTEVISKCKGKGIINWHYVGLEAPRATIMDVSKRRSISHANLLVQSPSRDSQLKGDRPKSAKPKPQSAKTRNAMSSIRLTNGSDRRTKDVKPDARIYTIEVTAPNGWPLNIAQWQRVDEILNSFENKPETTPKKATKDKGSSAKEKDSKMGPVPQHFEPQPGDAFIELEVSLTVDGGVVAKRDDERELAFAEARRFWDCREPGRNMRGSLLRKEFRDEYLVPLSPSIVQSVQSIVEENEETAFEEEVALQPAPTPVSQNDFEEEASVEEESLFLEMPEQLKDKFEPLLFVPLVTKEYYAEERIILTPEKVAEAKVLRQDYLEAAIQRMYELQEYNELHVLRKQKDRCRLLEKAVLVDAQYHNDLVMAFDERDEVVNQITQSEAKPKKK